MPEAGIPSSSPYPRGGHSKPQCDQETSAQHQLREEPSAGDPCSRDLSVPNSLSQADKSLDGEHWLSPSPALSPSLPTSQQTV